MIRITSSELKFRLTEADCVLTPPDKVLKAHYAVVLRGDGHWRQTLS